MPERFKYYANRITNLVASGEITEISKLEELPGSVTFLCLGHNIVLKADVFTEWETPHQKLVQLGTESFVIFEEAEDHESK